ncbi:MULTISPECIES: hypothetical protein [unclassified Rhizobium]|uniref:hypothetical protein n=1 Tax=unclassified Rhizobium TaxID=2613769 RepID=UPI002167107E|nr:MULTISPECIES: hypothetical protein [unclassified Rhizobium]MCS3741592.1 hypothetical protein [Rhizobium sp. BK661]MCS4093684.1 hypothetical protein [Rhizobium sp. BK176]
MGGTSNQNDLAIEEMLKDAITWYVLDRLEVQDRLRPWSSKLPWICLPKKSLQ